jgi:hypothetical protein
VGGGRCGEVYRRMNMVQILCTVNGKMCINGKMIHVETIPELGVEGVKEYGVGDEFMYDIFDML